MALDPRGEPRARLCAAGADICGFMNLASPELCARWIALGAWYPYARVHHAQSFQELYWRAWPPGSAWLHRLRVSLDTSAWLMRGWARACSFALRQAQQRGAFAVHYLAEVG